MKQYIWIAAVVAVTSVNAAENPFDPATNFSKIDHSEQQLLQDLEKIAREKEAQEDLELDAEESDTTGMVEEAHTPVGEKQPEEEIKVIEEKTETAESHAAPAVTIETPAQKEARLQRIKAEQERLEAERAAAAEAEKRRIAAEKAAREAIELERIKQAQAEKKAAEEKKAAQARAKREAEKAVLEQKPAEQVSPVETEAQKAVDGEVHETPSPPKTETLSAPEAETLSPDVSKRLEEAFRDVDQD